MFLDSFSFVIQNVFSLMMSYYKIETYYTIKNLHT